MTSNTFSGSNNSSSSNIMQILQAPASLNNSGSNINNNNILQPSNKHDVNKSKSSSSLEFIKHHHSVKKPQTPSVSRRNARERNRVKLVNNGFSTLRTHIPHLKSKTSKVDTLRAAVDYIRNLRKLLGEEMTEEEEERSREMSFSLRDLEEESSSSSPCPPSNPPSPQVGGSLGNSPSAPPMLDPSHLPNNANPNANANVLQMVFALPNDYNTSSSTGITSGGDTADLLSSMGFGDSSIPWYALPDEGFKHEIQ